MEEYIQKRENNRSDNGVEKRRGFLDILRVLATCAVVLLHTLTSAVDAVDINQYPFEKVVYYVCMDSITWCVPIFLMISGYLFLNPARSFCVKQMLKKYCLRILLALLLFGVPFAILELMLAERTFRFTMVGQAVWMVLKGQSWSHMWYLYLILFLYLVTPLLKYVFAKLPKGCIYLILAVLLTFCSIAPFVNKLLGLDMPMLPDGGIYLFYYICGYLYVCSDGYGKKSIEKQDGNWDKEKRDIFRWVNVVSVIVIFVVFVGMALSRICFDFSLQMAYNYPFTVLVSVLAFGVFKRRNLQLRSGNAAKWQKLSALCFAIYLIHPVFINF